MVTSRAVVGSSAMISDGLQLKAMAIAGQLVGVVVDALVGVRNADAREQISGRLEGLRLAQLAVVAQGLGDLLADRIDGVEAAHGLLEHHGNLLAAYPLQGFVVECLQVNDLSGLAFQRHLTGRHLAERSRHKPQNRKTGDGLA